MNINESSLACVVMAALMGASFQALAAEPSMNARAAQALTKESNCMKCHAVNKKKDGPSFQEIAAREKDKPAAEDALVIFLKKHGSLKSKDDAAVRNVARYILSR